MQNAMEQENNDPFFFLPRLILKGFKGGELDLLSRGEKTWNMLTLYSIQQSPHNTCKEWVKEQCEPHSCQPTIVGFQLCLRQSASSNAGKEGKIAQRQNGPVTGVEEVDTGSCYLVERLRCPYFQRYNNCLEWSLCVISPSADVSGFPRERSEARNSWVPCTGQTWLTAGAGSGQGFPGGEEYHPRSASLLIVFFSHWDPRFVPVSSNQCPSAGFLLPQQNLSSHRRSKLQIA